MTRRSLAAPDAARARVTVPERVVLDPAGFYGRNTLWLLSVGVRIGMGEPLHRMGRYGAMQDHDRSHHESH